MFNDPKRKPLIVDSTFVTVPVARGAEVAIMEWVADNISSLEEKLHPLGLTPGDLAAPEWRRLVYYDEALSFADRMAMRSIDAMEAQKAEDEARKKSRDPYAECRCNHGRHTHVAYTGACGLCDCPAVRTLDSQPTEGSAS